MRISRLLPLSVLVALLAAFGCAKRANSPSAPPVQVVFNANVTDKAVDIRTDLAPLTQPRLPKPGPSGDIEIQSRDWLELAEQLLRTGRDPLLRMGHRLEQSFYDRLDNSILMTGTSQPPGNPFIELAYRYATPQLSGQFKAVMQSASAKVGKAAQRTKIIPIPPSDKPEPDKVLGSFVDGLHVFEKELAAQKVNGDPSNGVLDDINGEVEKAVGVLAALQKDTVPEKGETSFNFLARLVKTLRRLVKPNGELPVLDKKDLDDIEPAQTIAKWIKKASWSDDVLVIVIDLWMNKIERDGFPAELYNELKKFQDSELIALATDNGPVLSDSDYQKIKARGTHLRGLSDREWLAVASQNSKTLKNDENWKKTSALKDRLILPLFEKSLINNYIDSKTRPLRHVTDVTEKLQIVVNHWLGLNMRLTSPPELRDELAKYSDSSLLLLRNYGSMELITRGHPQLALFKKGMQLAIEGYDGSKSATEGIAKFKAKLDDVIIEAVQWGLVDSLNPFAEQLPNLMGNAISGKLDEKAAKSDAWAQDTFYKLSRFYVSKKLFGVENLEKPPAESDPNLGRDNKLISEHPLPLYEKTVLHFSPNLSDPPRSSAPRETSAELLGLSMSNAGIRVRTMVPYEIKTPDTVFFRAINQMSMLIGYKGYDENLVEALTVPMTPGHAHEKMDIREYDPYKVAFATPDRVFIKGQYKLDPKSEDGATASLSGQMELLRGAGNMLFHLKHWKKEPREYEESLGSFRIEDIPDQNPFEKKGIYQLALGMASVVMRNLIVKNLGVIFENGDYKEASKLPTKPNGAPDFSGTVGVVLTSYDLKGTSHKVSTGGMAKALIAISEFYQVAADINQTEDEDIRKYLPQIEEYKPLIIQLLAGMAMFTSSKLMLEDGGFIHEYDLDKKKPVGEARFIEDQLLMQEALLKVGEVLASPLFRFRAVDNLFFLNNRFWNPKLGFYNAVEGDRSAGKVRLASVARALRNLGPIREILNQALTQSPNLRSSLDQIDALENQWLKRFFTSEIGNFHPVYQVLEFSL